MCTFLVDLMASVLPSCDQFDLTIDRIHQIPKPKNISPYTPRDTIHTNFFPIKEYFLRAFRKSPSLLDQFQQLSIYPDLCAATMLCRKGSTASNIGGGFW